MRNELKIALFWVIVFIGVTILRRHPHSLISRVAFTWNGPMPIIGEPRSTYNVRRAFFALKWLFVLLLIASLVFGAAAISTTISESESFMIVSLFVFTIGIGMATLGFILALLGAAKARFIGPNPEFNLLDKVKLDEGIYTKPLIEKLDSELTQEILKKSKIGKEILDKYIGDDHDCDAGAIDNAIETWRASDDKNKESESLMVDSLGSYFGNLLAKRLNLEWVIYRDYKGSDLCVIHKNYFVFSFPHSALYKAIIGNRLGALSEIVNVLETQILEAEAVPEIERR